MTVLRWGTPVALESAYDSRLLYTEGEAVGELYRVEAGGGWGYYAQLYSGKGTRPELGPYADAREAMEAAEVALGVRPLSHAETWGLPGAERIAKGADAAYGINRQGGTMKRVRMVLKLLACAGRWVLEEVTEALLEDGRGGVRRW